MRYFICEGCDKWNPETVLHFDDTEGLPFCTECIREIG